MAEAGSRNPEVPDAPDAGHKLLQMSSHVDARGEDDPHRYYLTHNHLDTPPPSYESLGLRLKKAKHKSHSPFEFFFRAYSIICGSFILLLTIILGVILVLPVTMIAIGVINQYQCPIDYKIPIWLIVSGCICSFTILLRISLNCHSMIKNCRGHSNEIKKRSLLVYLTSLIELTLFIWFLIGNYWVLSAHSTVNMDQTDSPMHCNRVCYMFALWMIKVVWVFNIALFSFVCLFCISCGTFYCCTLCSVFERKTNHSHG